jgi:hypothetical protein
VVVLTNSAHGADDIGFHLINPKVPLAPASVTPVFVKVLAILSTVIFLVLVLVFMLREHRKPPPPLARPLV